jgi:ectoine hydroxylase-related dioxygenase (phytanoyl-CoA dioxygenase family)
MTVAQEYALTDAQIRQFDRDGFLVVRGLYSPEEVAHIRDTFMEQAKDGPVEGLSEFRHGGQATYAPTDPLSFYPRMMHPHLHPELAVGPVAKDFLLDPRLRPILTALFGEEPVGVQTMFYFKPPGARGQDLHQDNFYLRVKPGTCMAAWLAVDDADEENGGMLVVPGSANLDIACPKKADPTLYFTSDHVDVPEGLHDEPITLKAGDVLFFNGSLIHGSHPNTSQDRFRRSLIAHYVPRASQEMSHWYTPMTFDTGEVIEIADATGGGPCGTAVPAMGPH